MPVTGRAIPPAALMAPLVLGLALTPASPVQAAPRPDVVIFLADDMGYSDLPGYGGEIDAPALESLAHEGVRFSQFTVTPRCSPTRASLLTGRSPHAAGVGWLADSPSEHEAYRGAIRPEVETLPEMLARADYRSYAVGKWHLDPAIDPAGPDSPRARGFERYFGVLRGADDFWAPESLARDDERLPPPEPPFYLTDAITEQAAAYVRRHAEETPERPFFLYVAFTAPHWPVQAPDEDIAAHVGRFADGWDTVRERRAERIRQLGFLGDRWALAPRDPAVPPWTQAPDPVWQRARMRAYAGMVRAMDRGVSRVLDAVRQTGRRKQTLVFFLSDNGASPETLSPASRWLRRAAGFWTPEHYGDDPSVEPGGPESFQSVGRGWSNVSNAPFRGHKAVLYEGGIASPLLVRWPVGLDAARGSWVHAPAHVTDLAATILELAGLSAPEELEGESFAPLLSGGTRTRGPVFWEHEGWAAVRDGDWKAVRPFRGEWELYDLAADRTELHDLAGERPEELARLVKSWDDWADRVGVQPWPWAVPVFVRAAWAVGAAALVAVALLAWVATRIVRRHRS
jgi:arylsulfatase